jgi:Flp pilus assembly pilin Flp
MLVWLSARLKSQDGQDLVEYALLVALLVVLAVASQDVLGSAINRQWGAVSTWLATVATTVP